MSASRKPVHRAALDPDLVRLLEDEGERHPEWPDVQNRLGLSLFARGRLSEAESRFQRCLEMNPRYAWATLNLAQCLAVSGKSDRARAVVADSQDPSPGAAAFVRAFVELAAGRFEDAEASLAELSPSLSRRADFLRLRAALIRHRDPATADALLAEARLDAETAAFDIAPWDAPDTGPSALLSLVPGMHQLWFEVSMLEARIGHPAQAEVSAVRAYLHWADLGLLLNQQGVLASLRNDDAQSVKSFERAAEVSPRDPRPHVSLMYHWSAAGELERAAASLRSAIERAPGWADLHHQMGLLARARDDAENALASFRRALDINPKYRLAHLDVAASLSALGRWGEALTAYREVLSTGLVSSDIYLHLGEAEARTGDVKAAERCYQDALKLNPGEALAHYRLGNLYREHGDRAGAKRAWKRFLKLTSDPDQAAVVEALLQDDEL
jgi:tetratricopeptide (TPR) repeat protein